MGTIPRRVESYIYKDLSKKMVLLSGPRQCGKTTLVSSIASHYDGTYYNWDNPSARKQILHFQPDLHSSLWVFDELHKFKRWRDFLKGLYDTYHSQKKNILVTGSAKLELYGRGGDSLQGRYFAHHLHPLTFSEIERLKEVPLDEIPRLDQNPSAHSMDTLKSLLTLGGFPEPFLSGSATEASRWRLNYGARLVQEEVKSLEQTQELERLELLFERLSDIAGSIVSINSLREDLEVAFGTVKQWLTILEKLDAIFRISPFGPPRIKTVKKEQKLYFWDWAHATSDGARFENLIAMHLLRLVHFMTDIYGEKAELRYFRDRLGHEVDFIVLRKSKPWFAVEVKLSEGPLAKSFEYFLTRLPASMHCPYGFQVFLHGRRETSLGNIGQTQVYSVSASRFLANLP